MRVALDLDSTLAATCVTAFDLMGVDYTYNDIESWDWGVDKFGPGRYLNSLWHAWTIRPRQIPAMEKALGKSTKRIYENVDQLDIVTSHPDGMLGVDDGKRMWIEDFGIFYNNYVSVDGSKIDLDYDLYIDDKPELAEDVEGTQSRLLLLDHVYNQGVGGNSTTRVSSVRESSYRIRDDYLR